MVAKLTYSIRFILFVPSSPPAYIALSLLLAVPPTLLPVPPATVRSPKLYAFPSDAISIYNISVVLFGEGFKPPIAKPLTPLLAPLAYLNEPPEFPKISPCVCSFPVDANVI